MAEINSRDAILVIGDIFNIPSAAPFVGRGAFTDTAVEKQEIVSVWENLEKFFLIILV